MSLVTRIELLRDRTLVTARLTPNSIRRRELLLGAELLSYMLEHPTGDLLLAHFISQVRVPTSDDVVIAGTDPFANFHLTKIRADK